jgi:hypothetical protein
MPGTDDQRPLLEKPVKPTPPKKPTPPARPVAPKKYDKGTVATLLEGVKDLKQRAIIKAQRLSQRDVNSFSRRDFSVTIDQLTTRPAGDDKLLEVWVTATYKDKPVLVSNPLLYKNPPIMVHDGTFHTVDVDGVTDYRPNYKEDLDDVLKEIVTQTLETITKKNRG